MSMVDCKVLGFGSPILDLLLRVDDAFLREHVDGEKGGMGMLDAAAQKKLIGAFPGGSVKKAIGGSAFNTISALTSLGMKTAFLGEIGQDTDGDYYRKAYAERGGDISRFRFCPDEPTATCVSLVTPDSERTMRTNLGAASRMTPDDISETDFDGITHFHVEGYMLFLPGTVERAMKLAKEHGCTVSMDLASFEVVRLFKEQIHGLLAKYVDIVFANEDEAREYCGDAEFVPESAADKLLQHCSTVAVKLGRKGALVCSGNEKTYVQPRLVKAADTTGAGDLWQAGFLYGYLNGLSLAQSGQMGSVLGAEIVQVLGAEIPPARWDSIRSELNHIKES